MVIRQRRSSVLAALLFLAAGPVPAAAANLLANPGFDVSLAGWLVFHPERTEWSPVDAGGDAASGSARNTVDFESAMTADEPLIQCVPLTPGAGYEVGFSTLVPAGQDRTGSAYGIIYFYEAADCIGLAGSTLLPETTVVDAWTTLHHTFTAPSGVSSAALRVVVYKEQAGGELVAYIDDAFFCPNGTCGGGGGDDDDLDAEWFTDPQYPDFRFRALIHGAEILEGAHETACQQDTVCISSALPGRSEVFVRILGPRPNGYLWPTITRFTPSQVQVEIEQISSGERQLYTLLAVPPDEPNLSGLQDREGFLP
ncbi:MAG TPA: hypothetical protein VMT16_09410 [Thermoanaerobaculia bacterium]|nr:hypothetical protein [Thermoanaerobaculia bacterium]